MVGSKEMSTPTPWSFHAHNQYVNHIACDYLIMRVTGKKRRNQGGAGSRMEPPVLDGGWGHSEGAI